MLALGLNAMSQTPCNSLPSLPKGESKLLLHSHGNADLPPSTRGCMYLLLLLAKHLFAGDPMTTVVVSASTAAAVAVSGPCAVATSVLVGAAALLSC